MRSLVIFCVVGLASAHEAIYLGGRGGQRSKGLSADGLSGAEALGAEKLRGLGAEGLRDDPPPHPRPPTFHPPPGSQHSPPGHWPGLLPPGLFPGSQAPDHNWGADRCFHPDVSEHISFTLGECQKAGRRAVKAVVPRVPQLQQEMPQPNRCAMHLPPMPHLSCNLTCVPGRHLTGDGLHGAYSCKECPAGKFSVGGGKVYQNFADGLPDEFTTMCYSLDRTAYYQSFQAQYMRNEKCRPWTVNGTLLSSGDNAEYNDVESLLVLHLKYHRTGSIWFKYRVNSEPRIDGLIFRFDHENIQIHPTETNLVSQQLEFRYVKFNVEPGWHVFKWIYAKDFSVSKGTDKAEILEIGYEGTEMVDTVCQECAEGFSSQNGASRCSNCQAGKVYNFSQSSCVACPQGKYSLPGFMECKVPPKCTTDDYTAKYGPCTGTTRKKNFEWMSPKICQDGIQLPGSMDVPCATCDPGYVVKGGTCSACPAGKYRGVEDAICKVCAVGHEAKPAHFYTTFTEWSPELSTGCEGECGVLGGWRMRDTFMDAGSGYGNVADSWLQLGVTMESAGKVSFNFSMDCDDDERLFVTVNGGSPTLLCSKDQQAMELELAIGDHDIRWVYSKESHTINLGGSASARIYGIVVVGLSTGGAYECSPCPEGYHSMAPTSHCQPCAAGASSPRGSIACQQCPPNTFAPYPGSPQCISCGANTAAPAGSRECAATCLFHDTDDASDPEYDLAPLRDLQDAFGPVTAQIYHPDLDGFQEHQMLFSVCKPLPSNASCLDDTETSSPTHAYACTLPHSTESEDSVMVNTNTRNLGTVMAFGGIGEGLRSRYGKGMTLVTNNGQSCPELGGDAVWETHIHIVCDLDAGVGAAEPQSMENSGELPRSPCQIHLVWKSQHGCPKCQTKDYTPVGGSCKKGVHDVKYVRNSVCYSATSPPDEHGVSCRSEAIAALPQWAIGLIVVGVLTLLGTILTFGYLWHKYYSMYSQYSNVGTSDSPYAADEF